MNLKLLVLSSLMVIGVSANRTSSDVQVAIIEKTLAKKLKNQKMENPLSDTIEFIKTVEELESLYLDI